MGGLRVYESLFLILTRVGERVRGDSLIGPLIIQVYQQMIVPGTSILALLSMQHPT
jgi:hypothetical protein